MYNKPQQWAVYHNPAGAWFARESDSVEGANGTRAALFRDSVAHGGENDNKQKENEHPSCCKTIFGNTFTQGECNHVP